MEYSLLKTTIANVQGYKDIYSPVLVTFHSYSALTNNFFLTLCIFNLTLFNSKASRISKVLLEKRILASSLLLCYWLRYCLTTNKNSCSLSDHFLKFCSQNGTEDTCEQCPRNRALFKRTSSFAMEPCHLFPLDPKPTCAQPPGTVMSRPQRHFFLPLLCLSFLSFYSESVYMKECVITDVCTHCTG